MRSLPTKAVFLYLLVCIIRFMSKKKIDKIGFLKDEPVKKSKDLKFGHSDTVSALEDIVRNNHNVTPITIGLFGGWGGGKSSLIESLKSRLKKDIPVVIFDVWKHEKDSLRRTFLNVFYDQLSEDDVKALKSSIKKDSRLYNSETESTSEPIISNATLVNVFLISSLLLLVYHGFLSKDLSVKVNAIIQSTLSPIFSAIGFSSLITLVVDKFLKGSLLDIEKIAKLIVPEKTRSIVFDIYQDPAQFEKVFNDYLSGLKKKYKRILIVFDNLDRVSADKAIELLTTINTFLDPIDKRNENKEVIFLIPCDDSAIRNALRSSKTTRIEDPDEFLKKFFNVHIRIPPFDQREIINSTHDKLLETEIDALRDWFLAHMIAQFYHNNPRQVIQFINVLVAHYRLAEKRSGSGLDFDENWLKENIRQLTRFLLLYEKYPKTFDWLYSRRLFNFDQLNKLKLGEWVNDGLDKEKEELRKTKIQFENDWKLHSLEAPIPNSRFLYSLRKSEHERSLPFLIDLQDYLYGGKKEDVLKSIKEHVEVIKDKIKLFSQAINDHLAYLDSVSAASHINMLVGALGQNNIRLEKESLGIIERLVLNEFQNDHLKIINLKKLIDYLYPKENDEN